MYVNVESVLVSSPDRSGKREDRGGTVSEAAAKSYDTKTRVTVQDTQEPGDNTKGPARAWVLLVVRVASKRHHPPQT